MSHNGCLASHSLAHAETNELIELAESAARYAAGHSLAPGDLNSLAGSAWFAAEKKEKE